MKKLFALLLALVILLSLMPAAAFATDPDDGSGTVVETSTEVEQSEVEPIEESRQEESAAASPHTHCICGGCDCTISGHNAAQDWTPLPSGDLILNSSADYSPLKRRSETDEGCFLLEQGFYFLTGDITTDCCLEIEGAVVVCLNGYSITRADQDSQAFSDAGDGNQLTIIDCRATQNIEKSDATRIEGEDEASETDSADGQLSMFSMNPYGNGYESIDTVNWWQSESGNYYIFLPSYCSPENAVVYFEANMPLYIGDTEMVSGEVCPAFTCFGEYTLSVGQTRYTLFILASENIPTIFIETESGSLDYIHEDKENKESGTIRVFNGGEITIDTTLKHIKGRGNGSWSLDKKPYNIKFDSKTKVLGMSKAKKWTLLSCSLDLSLAKNVYGWKVSDYFGIPYASDYRVVDLYINNDYLGTYIICESVEVGSNRIDINDLDDANEAANPGVDIETLGTKCNTLPKTMKFLRIPGLKKWVDIPNSPADISGGYLLEFEFISRFDNETSGFITSGGQCVVVKSPELATQSEIDYIYSIVDPALEAIYSENGINSQGKHYSEYFDMDSLVNMYILQELTSNIDACSTSFFLVKPEWSDKLICAPVWDLDKGYEPHERYAGLTSGATTWWVNSIYGYKLGMNTFTEKPLFYNAAYRHADFRRLVEEHWAAFLNGGGMYGALDCIRSDSALYAASSVMNGIRWSCYGTEDCDACLAGYYASVNEISDFVTTRIQSLTKGYGTDSAMLYYDANGGLGWIFQQDITSIGDTVTVLNPYTAQTLINFTDNDATRIVAADASKMFAGWNTEPDGSGEMFYPGDAITLKDRTVTLYAQWGNANEHIHQFRKTVVEPSCTKGGYVLHKCANCTYTYLSSISLPTGHKCDEHGICGQCGAFLPVISVNAAKSSIKVGETAVFTANVDNLPAGARVKWTVVGIGASSIVSEDTLTCTVKTKCLGRIIARATLVDSNGKNIKNAKGLSATASDSTLVRSKLAG